MSAQLDIRDIVISKVCHDIRNPLTSIINSIDILSEARADKETFEKFRDLIRLGAESIAIVVKNLSAFALIEKGAFSVSVKPCDITAVLNGSMKMNKPAFDMKWIDVAINIPEGLPQVSADAEWMKQAFNNVFSFFMKFMSSKEKLSVRLEAVKGKVVVRVIDGKRVIPETYLSTAFSEVRLDSEEAMQGAWMAFGLYVSKKILEAHKGDLRIEDGGDGAAFVMTLPAA